MKRPKQKIDKATKRIWRKLTRSQQQILLATAIRMLQQYEKDEDR